MCADGKEEGTSTLLPALGLPRPRVVRPGWARRLALKEGLLQAVVARRVAGSGVVARRGGRALAGRLISVLARHGSLLIVVLWEVGLIIQGGSWIAEVSENTTRAGDGLGVLTNQRLPHPFSPLRHHIPCSPNVPVSQKIAPQPGLLTPKNLTSF